MSDSKRPEFKIPTDPGMPQAGSELDVAIIGGGVSGLYTGWRLLTGGSALTSATKPTVHLFERSNRLGGKLETIYFDRLQNVPAPIGGMRYTKEMRIVHGLIHNVLHLEERDFRMGKDGEHRWFLRGAQVQEDDFEAVLKLYHLDPHEAEYVKQRGAEELQNPEAHYTTYDALLEYALEQILQMKKEQWPADREGWDKLKMTLTYGEGAREKPIYEYGFWNLLSEVLSSEAYQLITDACGYQTLTANVSAGEAIEFICLDFVTRGGPVQFKQLRWGYDCLPLALAERYTGAGGTIWRGNALVRVEETPAQERIKPDGRTRPELKLTFENQESGGTPYAVYAEHVVLALPRRALELIDFSAFERRDSPYYNQMQAFRQNQETVFGQPALKLFMLFSNPWWRKLGLESGRMITDLPIRQTYYFGSQREPMLVAQANDSDPALLMASYDDAGMVSFWKGLEWTPEQRKTARRYKGQGEMGTEGDVFQAPPEMVLHAKQQLETVHGIGPGSNSETRLEQPLETAYKDWSEDPYGGGWHLWNVGVKVWDVMKRMRRPMSGLHLYVTGEAYSGWQGWVEGALTVTENMLQEHFHLAYPHDWLYVEDEVGGQMQRRPYYLGW